MRGAIYANAEVACDELLTPITYIIYSTLAGGLEVPGNVPVSAKTRNNKFVKKSKTGSSSGT